MIIDAHTHHTRRGYLNDIWWFKRPEWGGRRGVTPVPPEERIARMERESGDGFIPAMDAAGIDVMVTMGLDWSLTIGQAPIPFDQQTKEHCELAQKYPDRIIALASVEPRRGKEGLDLFEMSVKEWGAKGLKLHPCAGFYANDRVVYPFYEKAVELDVPILIHTGIDGPPVLGHYGHPIYLDEVCTDFPELRICAGHMGDYTLTTWQDEFYRIAPAFNNLYMDLSGHARGFAADPVEKFRWLRSVLDRVGPGKVVFATDYPYAAGEGLADFVNIFKEVPKEVKGAGIEFTREELDGILENNAMRWLGSQAPKKR